MAGMLVKDAEMMLQINALFNLRGLTSPQEPLSKLVDFGKILSRFG